MELKTLTLITNLFYFVVHFHSNLVILTYEWMKKDNENVHSHIPNIYLNA